MRRAQGATSTQIVERKTNTPQRNKRATKGTTADKPAVSNATPAASSKLSVDQSPSDSVQIKEKPPADLSELGGSQIAAEIQPLIDAALKRGKAFHGACEAVRTARDKHKAASQEITAQRKQLSDTLKAVETTPTGLLWDYGDTLAEIKAVVGHGLFESVKLSLVAEGLSRTQMGRALAFRAGYAVRAKLRTCLCAQAEKQLREKKGTAKKKCDFEAETLKLLAKAASTAKYEDLSPPEQQLVESLCATIKEGTMPEHDIYSVLHDIYGQSPEQAAKCIVYVTLCVLA